MKKEIQHIPTGYKPSPLGPIPEDWEVKRLGEVCDFLDSQRVPIKDGDRVKMQGKYPYYGASGIIDYVNDYLFDDDLILLGEDGANILTRSTPLAFLVSGKVWVNNHAHVLKTNTNHNRYYICNYLESLSYDKYNTGTAQPKLNREICENILILLPNIFEQNRIAEILQLWDTAIAKQTALIEQLTLRKRGLMQQLLTGKKRLKGFEGEWKEVRLGKISSFFSGGTPKSTNKSYYNGNIPFIRSGEIDKDKTELFISQEGINNSSAKMVDVGDILYALYGATSGQCFLSKIRGAINQAILCIRPNANKYFIMSVLQFNKDNYYNSYLQGGQGNLSGEIVSNYRILIPSISEQNAIASVLINADKEIEIQKQKLAAMQEQKKGLMQVLLTGKRRVK